MSAFNSMAARSAATSLPMPTKSPSGGLLARVRAIAAASAKANAAPAPPMGALQAQSSAIKRARDIVEKRRKQLSGGVNRPTVAVPTFSGSLVGGGY